VLIGSLATGRRQREADAVITKVLGSTRGEVMAVYLVQYLLLAAFAALFATPLGIGLAWVLGFVLLDVEFSIDSAVLLGVNAGAIAITAVLGAMTIFRVLSNRPAYLLRGL
jgi:putative ABC transport system permease protein